MRTISDSIKDLLVAQGIANGLAGRPRLRGIGAGLREGADRPATVQPVGGYREPMGMKERGAADDGARSQLRQGEETADLNSRKDRGNVTPAKFTGLRIVVDNSRCKPIHPHTRVAPRGIGFHLVLVK